MRHTCASDHESEAVETGLASSLVGDLLIVKMAMSIAVGLDAKAGETKRGFDPSVKLLPCRPGEVECRVSGLGNRFSREQNEGIESLADSWRA